ncbi:MAG: hypothetical protein H6569_06040 [Lewinellaceae bacterium]|nr:hypothetical protein [Lewinellaceae bacterium]
MTKSVPPARILLFVLPVLIALLWIGLRDQPDPDWEKASRLARQQFYLLQDVPDSLQSLYAAWHKTPFRAGDSTALRIVSQPSLSNIEWQAFRGFFETTTHQTRMVVSGVTGVGATKQTKHVARLLTGRPENVLLIECAPQFDLDYHKKYIGDETAEQFEPGELLRFWQNCWQKPDQRFAVIVDNFDKINPETFFGPALWEAMSSTDEPAMIGGLEVLPPPNCHLFSVTHLGPGSLVEFSGEHFKRLGRQYIIEPNAAELIEYLRRKWLGTSDSTRVAAVTDTVQMQHYLYYFLKTNLLLKTRYGNGFQLGQGSNVRDFFRKKDLAELKSAYINHLNAFRPDDELSLNDFKSMDYAVRTDGLEQNSSFLDRQIRLLYETGYFVEISIVASTALLTFLAGWWVFRRREQLIRHYGERAHQVYVGFETQAISADEAARRLEEIKNEVDDLVMRRRLNYTEGLYFLAFVEDKVKRIEFARNVSQTFLELFNTFMEDDVLTESEYTKLRQFLQSIRHKIPEETYEQFRAKVEQTYAANN